MACGVCQQSPPPFDSSFIPYRFAAPVDELVRRFKFDGRLEIGPLLAELLHASIPRDNRPDVLVPIPLHPRRLRERGFNQALELVRHLRRLRAVPVDYASLIRVRDTERQTALDQPARQSNVAGAFAARKRMEGMQVALVDDVVTTGATVTAATEVLLKAGAERVEVWAVARTL